MPVITMTMGKGQADKAQKERLIKSFTDTAVDCTGISAQKFTILINELEGDNIGVGGLTLTNIKASETPKSS